MEKFRMRKVVFKAFAMVLSMMLAVTGIVPTFATDGKADKEGKHAAVSKAKAGKEDAKINKARNKRVQTFNLNESGNVKATLDGEKNVNVTATDESADMKVERDKWIEMVKALGGSYAADEISWENADVKDINFRNTKQIYLPEDSVGLFSRFKGDINGCNKLNTENVTDMEGMFSMTKKANPDVSNWDMTNVKDISYMFYQASNAKPDVSNWNTANVTDMGSAFYDASSANPDVSKWNTSKVTNMAGMFVGAESANPDVSKWDVSQVEDMGSMFFKSGIKKANLSNWNLKEELINNSDYTKAMFSYCGDLEYLKTPKGFKTSINEVDKDFKLVKLKKGSSVSIENEKVNLKDKYEVNKDGDKEAVYHIYRKDKYAGVTFDKNGGDKEAWVNHELVEKGKNFQDGGGKAPAEAPMREGDRFLGWATNADSGTVDFGEHTFIGKDMSIYALWANSPKNKKVTARPVKIGVLALEFNKMSTANKYKAVVTPVGKAGKPVTKVVAAKDVKTLKNGKGVIKVGGIKMNKFMKINLTALYQDGDVEDAGVFEYNASYAFTLVAPKLSAKIKAGTKVVKKKKVKVYTLKLKLRKIKIASGYEVKIVIKGKVKKIKLKAGKKKLKKFMVGSIKLPKKGKYRLIFSAFKKIKGKKYYGIVTEKVVK